MTWENGFASLRSIRAEEPQKSLDEASVCVCGAHSILIEAKGMPKVMHLAEMVPRCLCCRGLIR